MAGEVELKKEIEELKETVKNLAQKVKEQNFINISKEELEKLNKIKDEASEIIENIKNKNKENPLIGIAVAAAAGFVIGKLFCGKKDE